MYSKICDEFIKLKNNYERIKNAHKSLRDMSLENSSLDNLIKASLNPINQGYRTRLDSLNQISHQNFGRKRAMTIDGPTRERYAPLKISTKSAFSTFKHVDPQIAQKAEVHESIIKRKRTKNEMNKDFQPQSSQLLLSADEDFPSRKRAKSF